MKTLMSILIAAIVLNGSTAIAQSESEIIKGYHLPDELGSLYHLSGQRVISQAFPNPATTYTKIDYHLPEGIEEGYIVFLNHKKDEVKRVGVNNRENHVVVSTSKFDAGTYFFFLFTDLGISKERKMVKMAYNFPKL